MGKKCEKEATLQGVKVLLAGRCSLLAVNEGFSGSGRQPSFDPEAAAWDEADTAECRGEVGRNWVFGKNCSSAANTPGLLSFVNQ